MPIVLYADQEHDRLRALVLVVIVILLIISFVLLRTLFTLASHSGLPDYATVLSCLGSLPISLGLTWVLEQQLKRHWPSGNQVVLQDGRILVQTRHSTAVTFDLNQNATWIHWWFRMGNYPRAGSERRVPKNWVCLACQWQQDDNRLVIFAFLPPAGMTQLSATLPVAYQFHEIKLRDVYPTGFSLRLPARPEIATEILRGADGRYWLAERRRWQEGLELTPADFQTFLQYVMSHQAVAP